MVKVIKQSVSLVWHTPEPEQTIAHISRTCYKSEDRETTDTNKQLIRNILKRRHMPMFDHASVSLKFVTDRGISHEIVRHRIGVGYAQESTRYVNYGKDKFNNEISVICPSRVTGQYYGIWLTSCEQAEKNYLDLLNLGASPQDARSVLPTCTKTEIVITGTLTYWLHFFDLRTRSDAHPDMVSIANIAYKEISKLAPLIFPGEL